MKFPPVSGLACAALLLAAALAHADVKLPALISDHMVLQKADAVPVWGKADAGEEVAVTLDRQTRKTVADAQGRWRVDLDLKDARPGPWTMSVQGRNTITVSDVMVGEVWIASGQSNMEFSLKEVLESQAEIAQAANPLLRHFDVENSAKPQPVEDCKGSWVVAAPDTAGKFSAVGYYFGKMLQRELKVPVGILNTTWGGSSCEAWTSREALSRDPQMKESVDRLLEKIEQYPRQKECFVAEFSAWLKARGREDKPCASPEAFAGLDVSTEGWTPVTMPGKISAAEFAGNGAIWVRRDVDVPEASANKPLQVELGVFAGYQTVFWNGQKLNEMTYETYPGKGYYSRSSVPANLVKAGRNVLALRIYAPVEAPKLTNQPTRLQANPIPLDGVWLAKAEYAFPPLEAAVLATAPVPPDQAMLPHHVTANLFNGMLNPLIPYAMRGVIWYQGEANASRAVQYRLTFPRMIEDWRQRWGRGDFPFYFCQLANYMAKARVPKESEWAELREAQSMTLKLPRTGQAVLIDAGESDDIHPRNKADVGRRLALIALANDYGKPVASSGPVYEGMQSERGKIRLKFSHTDGGLVARPVPETYGVRLSLGRTAPLIRNAPKSELEGFALCGEDRKWVWAEARIEGESVLVWSTAVQTPVAVRYGWADNPTCNLYNGAGLPAAPFRTDNFPELTREKFY